MAEFSQYSFDLEIGGLDRLLSVMVLYSKTVGTCESIDLANQQTLKHHAEDMVAAGNKILENLKGVEGLPQPSKSNMLSAAYDIPKEAPF